MMHVAEITHPSPRRATRRTMSRAGIVAAGTLLEIAWLAALVTLWQAVFG